MGPSGRACGSGAGVSPRTNFSHAVPCRQLLMTDACRVEINSVDEEAEQIDKTEAA